MSRAVPTSAAALTVPARTQMQAVRFSDASGAPRHIHVEEGAVATFVISIASSYAVDVTVDDDASCTVILITLGEGRIEIAQRGIVHKRGALSWQNATVGSGAVTHTLRTDIVGEDATASVDWLASCTDNARCTLSATTVFSAARGGGEMTMKGIAAQEAHVAWSGKIEIGPGGGGTQTYLTQDALMLDPSAVIESIPALEIKTESVKASHSASVRRVQPEDLFYLQSRGIGSEEARSMFIDGFTADLLDRFSDKEAKAFIARSLPQGV